MTLVAAIANVLKERALVGPVAKNAKRGGIAGRVSVELEETKAGMKVEVVDLPVSVAVIRMDRVGHSSGLAKGCMKICDYLLLVAGDRHTYAIFVELKRTRSSEQLPR